MARTTTEAINSYITDMLALEEHIDKAIGAQIDDLDDKYADIGRELESVQGTIRNHISALKTMSDARDAGAGKGIAEAVKRAGSIVAGLGAAAVDLVRTEKLPKDLRDDYTAASLATIGYVMLETTALSLGDREVGDLAQRHLADYARVTMRLHNVIPGAVVRFLREDGLPARDDAMPEISRNIGSVWQQDKNIPNAEEAASGRR